MPHPADLVLDANYAGPFAADGEYFAPGIPLIAGQGLACRVMRGGRQAGLDIGGMDMRPSIDTETLKVRVREVARPLRGGAFHLREERAFYRLMAEPDSLDRHRREWTCEALRLSDIVIPPPFAAVTGRGAAGAPVRGVSISAAAIGRGRAGAISLLQILSAPAGARGVAGGLARTVQLEASATGAGRASGDLDVQGVVLINAPATGIAITGGLLRAGLIDGAATARAFAGSLTRAGVLTAAASGRGRAMAALEAQGVILIDAAATGLGVAGTLTREAPLAALASGQAVSGGVVRNVPLAALASAAGAAGGLAREIVISASARGRGVALPALQLDGAIEINSPATGRGVAGSVLREAFLAAAATGRGASGAPARQSLLVAPVTGRGMAEAGLLRAGVVELDVTVTGRGAAGTLAREILIDALAVGQGAAGGVLRQAEISGAAAGFGRAGSLQRDASLIAAATGAGRSGGLQRAAPLDAAATGAGTSGAPVRSVRIVAPATGSAAAPEALLRQGVLASPATGAGRVGALLRGSLITGAATGRGAAGSVVGEDGPGASTRTAPIFRSASSATVSTTIARPAGVVAGDLIIGMFVDYESTTATITVPSGWTAIGSILRGSSGGASILMQLAYRVATGAEPTSYSWGTTSGDYPCAILAAYQSCDVSNPVAAIQSATGAGTARQQPAATAANDNSARIGLSAGYGSSAATPAGMTSRASSNAGINALFDLIPVSAGALGAISHGTDFLWVGATLVINGAPS